MSAINSKRKGTDGERAVAAAYRQAGFRAGRVPLSGAGFVKGDLRVPDCAIVGEVKACERLELWSALGQAEAAAEPHELPVLHFKRNRSGWYVAVPFDAWLAILGLAAAGAEPATLRTALAALAVDDEAVAA